jgi:preprotein translocase subunit SecG
METKTAMKWALALLVGFGIIALGFRYAGWLLTTFFVLNCLVLIIVVLLQSGKAADLAGAFGGAGSQTAFGPRGAANVLSKATTWCAIMFMVCAFAMVLRTDKAVGAGSSVLEKVSQPAPKPAPATVPAAPAPAPATSPSTTPATTPSTTQPASQPTSAPATKPTTAPSTSQPNSKPASQPPAPSQPAPAQPKKP